jgi:hypothetical protein
MKKIVLLFLFLATLFSIRVYAQNQVVITDLSSSVVNGTTISINSTDLHTGMMDIYLRVKNNTEQELNLYVRRIMNTEVDSSANSFCFGVLCYGEATDTSTTAVLLLPGHDTTFSGDYLPNLHTGLTSITYEFFDNRTGALPVAAQVTVNYNLSLVGIAAEQKAFEVSAAYPNPASVSTSFEYSIPSGSEGKIVLRNLIGNIVREVVFEKPEGRIVINTNELTDGLYFYSVLLNNKVEVTRKLVVRH